jgi:hypothetical protein
MLLSIIWAYMALNPHYALESLLHLDDTSKYKATLDTQSS